MSTARPAPGTFFFVVGPSGAGKDTLIDGVRTALAGEGYVFARRVITRPANSVGEDHDAETPDGFARRAAAGEFLLTWQAHGLDYGLPAGLLNALAAGSHVVANGSRAMVAALAERVPGLVAVEVTAPHELVAARIASRGRETPEEVLARLARQVDPLPPGVLRQRVVNDGSLVQGIARFVQVLRTPVARYVARPMPVDTGADAVAYAAPGAWPALTRVRVQSAGGGLADVRIHLEAVTAALPTAGARRPDPVPPELGANELGANELGLPAGLMRRLNVSDGDVLHALPVGEATSRDAFIRKLRGGVLDAAGFEAVFQDAVDGRYTESELTAFLVATTRDLGVAETLALARARTRLAKPIVWDEAMVVDKHSMGGVPGSRITLIVVPIVAAFGLAMPKASSRAITSAAGTADAMEVLANVTLDAEDVRRCVAQARACIAWNGRINHNVIDDVMNRITRPMGLDTAAWSVASILSKKVTSGVTHLMIDVPYGPHTKLADAAQAQALCDRFEQVGAGLGLYVHALATDGTRPIGRGIGPALEVRDVRQVLAGDLAAPQDLRAKALRFAARILAWDMRVGSVDEGLRVAHELLDSGAAQAALERIVQAQGARAVPVALANHVAEVCTPQGGTITGIDGWIIGGLARDAGAPGDPGAGIDLLCGVGQVVPPGAPLYRVHATSPEALARVLGRVQAATGTGVSLA
jgi:thymidine phosphorylase